MRIFFLRCGVLAVYFIILLLLKVIHQYISVSAESLMRLQFLNPRSVLGNIYIYTEIDNELFPVHKCYEEVSSFELLASL